MISKVTIATLLLSIFAHNHTAGGHPVCDLCKDALPPGITTGALVVLQLKDFGGRWYKCTELYELGLAGGIPEQYCKVTQYYAQRPCGCREFNPGPQAAPSNSWTVHAPGKAPVSAPSIAMTSPKSSWNPPPPPPPVVTVKRPDASTPINRPAPGGTLPPPPPVSNRPAPVSIPVKLPTPPNNRPVPVVNPPPPVSVTFQSPTAPKNGTTGVTSIQPPVRTGIWSWSSSAKTSSESLSMKPVKVQQSTSTGSWNNPKPATSTNNGAWSSTSTKSWNTPQTTTHQQTAPTGLDVWPSPSTTSWNKATPLSNTSLPPMSSKGAIGSSNVSNLKGDNDKSESKKKSMKNGKRLRRMTLI